MDKKNLLSGIGAEFFRPPSPNIENPLENAYRLLIREVVDVFMFSYFFPHNQSLSCPSSTYWHSAFCSLLKSLFYSFFQSIPSFSQSVSISSS